MLPSKVENIE
jgi:hypothetical protein